jgi:hypothetical protein
MGRLAWSSRPLTDGLGDMWRWDLGTVAELPSARAALRSRIGGVGFPDDLQDAGGERLILAFDELASNALRHGASPVVATVVAGSGGWLLDVGLHLVARMSVAHGWYVDGGTKHVWACLPATIPDREPALA